MSICIPCEWKKKIERARLDSLLKKAKERAIENNEYFVLHYDEEDKKYCIASEETASVQGYEVLERISPYQATKAR